MKVPSKKELPRKRLPEKVHGKQYPKPLKQVEKKRYVDLLGLAIIILLGIFIYSNSFNCSFHFDDFRNIVNNTKIQNLNDVQAWWNFYPGRSIGFFTFALNYHFNQLDVRYFHLVNLIIHLINACLVGWLTLLIFSSPAMKDHPIAGNKKVLAFLTALLFVSHPLATQSVTYIVQRLASLVAMFYILSLILYIKARLSNKGNISKILLFTGSFFSALLAMLTKENAFTLPFAIVLFEIFFLRTKKFSINFRDYRMILLLIAFLGVIMIIPLKFSFSIFERIPPRLGHTYSVTPVNYFLTQFSVIVKYIQLLFLPINQKLDYDFPISDNFFELRTPLCLFVLLLLAILATYLFKRNRIISFGIFWFFLTLSVESSFIPLDDLIWEHRTYLPSFGFFLILTSVIYFLLWKKHKYLTISIFIIMIGSNSYLTYERNKVWKDDLSLWSDNVAKTPNLPRALFSRGYAYTNLGQWDKSIADYSKAIEINPKYMFAYNNRGQVYGKLSQWDKAIVDYSGAIELDSKYLDAYDNRGVAYGNLGRWDKAIADFSMAIGINPNYFPAYFNRGLVDINLGQWEKALADYSKVIEINPNYVDAYCYRGVSYGNLGQYDKAIADFSKALEIDPYNTKAYSNREVAYSKLHDEKR
jgi:Tfp pilus assembly protein PilF